MNIRISGNIMRLAAVDSAGPLFVTSYRDDIDDNTLTGVDLSGKIMWAHDFHGMLSEPRVGQDGTVWIAHGRTWGLPEALPALSGLDANGVVLHEVTPEHGEDEFLAAFVVLPDGFCVMWLPTMRPHVPEHSWQGRFTVRGYYGRIARHRTDGSTMWSTSVHFYNDDDPLPDSYALAPGVASNWQVKTPFPGMLRRIDAPYDQPLVVAGHRIAASVANLSSYAVTYFLDTETGEPHGQSHASWRSFHAIVGPGEFLIGNGGPRKSGVTLHGADGTITREWPASLLPVIDRHGTFRGTARRCTCFVVLEPNGDVRRDALLPDSYHTSYPAIDEHGTTVFWRYGRLLAVDDDCCTVRELLEIGGENGYSSRMLLLEDGLLAFALKDELILHREPSLGALDSGVWPCEDGGLRGNPVAFL